MISIIIPVYNGENFIADTVEHILKSTYSDIEVVIVDDGSTDSSKKICEDMAQADSRILYCSKDNGGVISARNYGVEISHGEYLCFCDQDDFVEPQMYERLVAKLQADDSQFAMCSTGRNIEGKKSDFEICDDACYEGEEIKRELLFPLIFNGYNVSVEYSKTYRYPHIWSCIFRRDFWDTAGLKFRAYINFEDDLLVKVEALSKAMKVSTISYRGYYWRVNLKSETYAHKFVENLGYKQQRVLEDMLTSLSFCEDDKDTLQVFSDVTHCKQYLDAVHNLTSPQAPKGYKYRKKYYKDTIYEREWEKSVKARKFLKKGTVKPHVILPLLAQKMTTLSFVAEKILDYVLLVTLHSQALTKFERWLKKQY